MFDSIKNMAALPGMLAKAREMQDKMKTMQEELSTRQFSADSSNGGVTAIVDGKLMLLRVRIDHSKFSDSDDIGLLERSIVQAVAMAQMKATEMIATEMSKMASEMGLPPGMLPG